MTTSPTRLVRRSDGAEVLLVRRYRLTVDKGTDKGQAVELDRERATVGTTEGATLRLTDSSVSRLHFEVVAHAAGFLVRDLGSTNGTTVEGLRVVEAFLPATARIEAGQSLVRFETLGTESEVPLPTSFGEMVGHDASMRRLFASLASVAATDTTVLVEGETGTGKELVAQGLHEASPRKSGPLVVVDCGGLPATLVEAELFGYEKGSFTGAVTAKAGAFEAADGGTIFLDEVGEMPIELQPKLLRVLESRSVRRIGQTQGRPIDVRVVAATNRDLRREVNRGAFRSDLFYRLAVVMVRVPPLRERPDDVPALVEHMLEKMAERTGRRFQVSARTLERLKRHGWPGNVRELRNFVERSTTLAAGPHLGVTGMIDEPGDGSEPDLVGPPAAPPVDAAGAPLVETGLPYKVAKQRWIDAFEARYLTSLLERTEGNVAKAAREAAIDRAYLFRLIKRYDIQTRS